MLFFLLRVRLARNGAKARGASRRDLEHQPKRAPLRHTAEYKQHILHEAESAAATPGGLGALLRREGLYSSHLVNWRRERSQGIREALAPRKRGPKSNQRNSLAEENQKLRRQVGRLTEKLRQAELIIEVQKKVAALLGHTLPEVDPKEPS